MSPILFSIVINSLLRNLEAKGQGLSISGLHLGASAHADDLRALSNFPRAAEIQGTCLKAFCNTNSLTLNGDKTEVVVFTKGSHKPQTLNVAGQCINTQSCTKCLGVWLEHNLSSSKSIEENIAKARRAFFAIGALGAFQGKCNPLTGRSIFETFVIPVLLYRCEAWILTQSLTAKLEKFQSEIGKRILQLSKFHNNTAPMIGLHLPSMKVQILLRKLSALC